jgi:hypothetical protein
MGAALGCSFVVLPSSLHCTGLTNSVLNQQSSTSGVSYSSRLYSENIAHSLVSRSPQGGSTNNINSSKLFITKPEYAYTIKINTQISLENVRDATPNICHSSFQ